MIRLGIPMDVENLHMLRDHLRCSIAQLLRYCQKQKPQRQLLHTKRWLLYLQRTTIQLKFLGGCTKIPYLAWMTKTRVAILEHNSDTESQNHIIIADGKFTDSEYDLHKVNFPHNLSPTVEEQNHAQIMGDEIINNNGAEDTTHLHQYTLSPSVDGQSTEEEAEKKNAEAATENKAAAADTVKEASNIVKPVSKKRKRSHRTRSSHGRAEDTEESSSEEDRLGNKISNKKPRTEAKNGATSKVKPASRRPRRGGNVKQTSTRASRVKEPKASGSNNEPLAPKKKKRNGDSTGGLLRDRLGFSREEASKFAANLAKLSSVMLEELADEM